MFAGIKGATPNGSKQYSYKMPAEGNAEILASDLIYFQRDEIANNTWLIRPAADLKNWAAYVNGGNGITFKLARDINLESIENFTPIGNSRNRFRGTFDGNVKKISNLTINTAKDYAGLFGCMVAARIIYYSNMLRAKATIQSQNFKADSTLKVVNADGTLAQCSTEKSGNDIIVLRFKTPPIFPKLILKIFPILIA
ncbi:MAG: hypothetical protein IJT73_01700 [Selenomonadaceae bacterium]|nr:hypothetical protein [Selenomonadaceae bacterium]